MFYVHMPLWIGIGVVWFGTARHGTARHGTWHGMAHCTVWHGMACHGLAGSGSWSASYKIAIKVLLALYGFICSSYSFESTLGFIGSGFWQDVSFRKCTVIPTWFSWWCILVLECLYFCSQTVKGGCPFECYYASLTSFWGACMRQLHWSLIICIPSRQRRCGWGYSCLWRPIDKWVIS